MIDLIYNNAIYYFDDKTTFVITSTIKEIPAHMAEEAAEYRAILIEEVAATDDALDGEVL